MKTLIHIGLGMLFGALITFSIMSGTRYPCTENDLPLSAADTTIVDTINENHGSEDPASASFTVVVLKL